jgi:hypothetical protein
MGLTQNQCPRFFPNTQCLSKQTITQPELQLQLQLEGILNASDFSVRVTEESVVEPDPLVGGLLQQLARIPEAEVRIL